MAQLRNFNLDRRRVRQETLDSRGYDVLAFDRGEELKDAAIDVFKKRQKKTNEQRTSETTPPKYVDSFEVERLNDPERDVTHHVINTDQGATMVEFGAKAGGETEVLKYRPLGTALEIVASRHD